MALAYDRDPLPAVGGRVKVTRHVNAGDGDASRLDLGYDVVDEAGFAGPLQVSNVLALDVLHHEEPGVGVA